MRAVVAMCKSVCSKDLSPSMFCIYDSGKCETSFGVNTNE